MMKALDLPKHFPFLVVAKQFQRTFFHEHCKYIPNISMFLYQLVECGVRGFERLESVCWNCRFGEIGSWPGTLRIMSSMR